MLAIVAGSKVSSKLALLANLLVGEMVSKVVAHAPCHVLIVAQGAPMWRQRVLAAAEPTAQGRQIVATATAVVNTTLGFLTGITAGTGGAGYVTNPAISFSAARDT